MHIICCSKDKKILENAKQLSMDIFEFNKNEISMSDCRAIQDTIISIFAKDIPNNNINSEQMNNKAKNEKYISYNFNSNSNDDNKEEANCLIL